jgi:hypothetical protein
VIKSATIKKSDSVSRTCLVVLDINRSTSDLFAHVLHLLGSDLPKTPLEFGVDGHAGHGTSEPVARLNEAILASLGAAEHDWRPLDPGWHNSPTTAEFRQWALTAADQEFDGSSFVVLREPGLGRIAPFWFDVLVSAGLRPLIVVPVHSSGQMVASPADRDGSIPELDRLVWLRHMLEVEAASRDMPRIFFSCENLLTDWRLFAARASSTLDVCWPCPPESAAPADLPPLNWSFLMYGFGHEGGQQWEGSGIRQRRSSRSFVRPMC